jgi:transcriptional regulator with XRE-family HTH domain
MPAKFSDRIRKIREERGLSQSELAEKAGLQTSAISHFETGRRAPSFDNLKRLADALSTPIDALLERKVEATAAGPLAEQVFRDFGKMSASDQESLAKMAAILAQKSKR